MEVKVQLVFAEQITVCEEAQMGLNKTNKQKITDRVESTTEL